MHLVSSNDFLVMINLGWRVSKQLVQGNFLELVRVKDDWEVHMQTRHLIFNITLGNEISYHSFHFSFTPLFLWWHLFIELVSKISIFIKIHRTSPAKNEGSASETAYSLWSRLQGHVFWWWSTESEGIGYFGGNFSPCIPHDGH